MEQPKSSLNGTEPALTLAQHGRLKNIYERLHLPAPTAAQVGLRVLPDELKEVVEKGPPEHTKGTVVRKKIIQELQTLVTLLTGQPAQHLEAGPALDAPQQEELARLSGVFVLGHWTWEAAYPELIASIPEMLSPTAPPASPPPETAQSSIHSKNATASSSQAGKSLVKTKQTEEERTHKVQISKHDNTATMTNPTAAATEQGQAGPSADTDEL